MQSKSVTMMRAGDTVYMHGGIFRVLADAQPTLSLVGPSDCAVAQAVCLSGEVFGYFRPGSPWTFQGNQHSSFAVEAQS